MLTSLRHSYTQLITSGGQLLLLFAGFYFESPAAWPWILGCIAIVSLFAWLSVLHRYRLILGTPTSRIASAAQGYVELLGHAHPEGAPIMSKFLLLPCLWYRYQHERKNQKNEWHTVETGESSTPFRLDDGSGSCVVDPRGAEIIARHKDRWQVGDERFTEWKVLELDEVYALGEFKTIGGSNNPVTHEELVKQVLHEWKLDNAHLLQRFDLDGNGMLDMDEWMLARQSAKREARKRLNEARAEPDTHFMLKPQDGRLFLISNLSPENLARRYALWTWLHLIIFFGALGGITWLIRQTSP
ncbi:MAG: GIDE domain-containing protein [Sideroxydans sp.]